MVLFYVENNVGKIFDGMYCEIFSDMGIQAVREVGVMSGLEMYLMAISEHMSLIRHVVHIRSDMVFPRKLSKDYFHLGPHR
jgi:hypothetical protein